MVTKEEQFAIAYAAGLTDAELKYDPEIGMLVSVSGLRKMCDLISDEENRKLFMQEVHPITNCDRYEVWSGLVEGRGETWFVDRVEDGSRESIYWYGDSRDEAIRLHQDLPLIVRNPGDYPDEDGIRVHKRAIKQGFMEQKTFKIIRANGKKWSASRSG